MQVILLANELQQKELLAKYSPEEVHITRVNNPGDFKQYEETDVIIDLLFDNSDLRVKELMALASNLIIVSSVSLCKKDILFPCVRINGWPGFLDKEEVEAFCDDPFLKEKAEALFTLFDKKPAWCPDTPGFIAPRVVAMIINEAWLTLQEGIAEKEEIDTAMKLGTGYPYGPFEWGEKIGLENIAGLLEKLAETNKKYSPCTLLKSAASG